MSTKIDPKIFLKEQRKLLWLLLCPELPESPNVVAAQQLIKSYAKVDQDIRNGLTLLLHALEAGTAFLCDVVNMDEDFYDAMMGFWNDFDDLMENRYLEEFQDELLALRKKSQDLEGYGYRDHVEEVLENLGLLEDDE